MKFHCLLLLAALFVGGCIANNGQADPAGDTENFLNEKRFFFSTKGRVERHFEAVETLISNKYAGGEKCEDMLDVKMKIMLDLAEGGKVITNNDIDDNKPAPDGVCFVAFDPLARPTQNQCSKNDISKRDLVSTAQTIEAVINEIAFILSRPQKRFPHKILPHVFPSYKTKERSGLRFSIIKDIISKKYDSNSKCKTVLEVKMKMAYDLARGGVITANSPIADDKPAPDGICFASYSGSPSSLTENPRCNPQTSTSGNLSELKRLVSKVESMVGLIKEMF